MFRNCNCRKRWSRFRQFPVRRRPPCIDLIMRSATPRGSKTACLTAPTAWSASHRTNKRPAVSCTCSRNAWSSGFAAIGDGRPNPNRSNGRPIDQGSRCPEMTTATMSTRSPRCTIRVTKLKDAVPDYVQSSARSGGLTRAAVFLGSRASVPADGARSVAFASLPRAGSPRSQEANGPSCRSPDEDRA